MLLATIAIALIGIAQFLFCVSQAMEHYPGGNILSATDGGYDWQRNWLSDLGRTQSWSKQPNRTSALYFNRSIIVLGATLFVFFLSLGRSAEDWDLSTLALQIGGGISCAGLVILGFTPFDTHHIEHLAGLSLWILPIPALAILFANQCFKTAGLMGWIGGIIAFSIALILVLAIVAYGMAGHATGYVVMQKIVVGISIVWFGMVCLRVLFAAIETMGWTRRQVIAKQADWYESRLRKGHRKRS